MWNIVLGPPGTGKTTYLLNKVEMFLEAGIKPDKLGYVAFTKKAANEALVRAVDKFDFEPKELVYFRTLHSLGFEVLNYTREMVMKSDDYKTIGKKCGIEVSYASWDEDNGGLFTSDSPYLSLINLSKSKNITVEQQYNLGQHKEDLN